MTPGGIRTTLLNSSLHAARDFNYNLHNIHSHYGPDPLTVLGDAAALGALHDAAERPDPPKCHPETRTAVLDRINEWMRDQSHDAKPILWLKGPAGAGKSAVAQAIIERWIEEGIVCPNFFFWRTSPERNIKTHLVLTLAFQLAKMLPTTRKDIEKVVQDGGLFHASLKTQMQRLIIDPLLAAHAGRLESADPIVFVIDGLDECCLDLQKAVGFPGQTYEEQQAEILELIAFACQSVDLLRILVASRPEREIRASFASDIFHRVTLSLSLNNDINADNDIRLYLECKFADIRKRESGISPSWPSRDQISQLVLKASGQFIYPSTVVKYILRRRQHPTRSLELVLSAGSATNTPRDHPLAELDALYSLILGSVTTESWTIVNIILGITFYHEAYSPLNRGLPSLPSPPSMVKCRQLTEWDVPYFERLLFLNKGELFTHFTDLHSILYFSDKVKDLTLQKAPSEGGQGFLGFLRFFHATFPEYLKDHSRSGEFFVGQADTMLHCSLTLVKHAAQTSCFSYPHIKTLDPIQELEGDIMSFCSWSTPSEDLMKGLWGLLKDLVGEYSQVSNIMGEGIYNTAFYDARASRYHGGTEILLKYLLRCNIPEIEPSDAQRRAAETRLKKVLFHVSPGDYWALYPNSDAPIQMPQNQDNRRGRSRW